MKLINESELASVSGGEMSTPTIVIIAVATVVAGPVFGGLTALAYYAASDMKDCG